MFDSASDFQYVTGADIDADHPNGDLDRIRLSGIRLMPMRISIKDPLYGKDVAFLLEASCERKCFDPTTDTPPEFSRKLSVYQLQVIAANLSNANNNTNSLRHFIDPLLIVAEKAISDISGYEYLDTLVGAPRWQVPMQTTVYTFNDRKLRRSDIRNLFDTVKAMKTFVDRLGGNLLAATGHSESDQDADLPFIPTILDGYFYISVVSYRIDNEAHVDKDTREEYYSVNGYPKFKCGQWYATGSVLWEMPTPACLVGKLKEVWALVHCHVREVIYYRAQGSVSRYSTLNNPLLEQADEVSCYRLVKCNLASSHTIVAGDKLRIIYNDLADTISTLLSDAGKSRWGSVQNPPRGVLIKCEQIISCDIVDVYPVWEITHTGI